MAFLTQAAFQNSLQEAETNLKCTVVENLVSSHRRLTHYSTKQINLKNLLWICNILFLPDVLFLGGSSGIVICKKTFRQLRKSVYLFFIKLLYVIQITTSFIEIISSDFGFGFWQYCLDIYYEWKINLKLIHDFIVICIASFDMFFQISTYISN